MERILGQLGIDFDWRFTLIIASLIFIRWMMISATIPFLTGKPVPAALKVSLALAVVVFLYPYLAPADRAAIKLAPLAMIFLYLKEALYGIAIGFTASIVFYGFEAAGSMIDNQRGAAQARLLIPQFGQEGSVFGQFVYLLGVVLFISIGGHLFFFETAVRSYEYLPLLEIPKASPDLIGLVDEFVELTGLVLLLSIQLCAPVLIAILVADLILGIISKAAPASNVWEMGFVIRGVLGVLVVFLSLGLMVTQMEKISLGMVQQVEGIIRFLAKPL